MVLLSQQLGNPTNTASIGLAYDYTNDWGGVLNDNTHCIPQRGMGLMDKIEQI